MQFGVKINKILFFYAGKSIITSKFKSSNTNIGEFNALNIMVVDIKHYDLLYLLGVLCQILLKREL